MSRTYELSFKLGAKMAGDFARTMSSASGAIGQLSSKINEVGQQQANLQGLINVKKQVAETAKEFIAARSSVAGLGQQLSESNKQQSAYATKVAQSKQAVEQIKASYDQQSDALRTANEQYRAAQQRVNLLAAEIKSAEAPTDEMVRNFEKAQSEASDLKSSLDQQRASVKNLRGEYQSAKTDLATVSQEAKESEQRHKALAQSFDNAKTKLDRTKASLQSQRTELRSLSTELDATGQSTKELIQRQEQLARSAEKAKAAQASLQSTLDARSQNIANRDNLRGQLFDAAGMAASMAVPIKLAANWEQNLAELNKVASKSPEALQGIANSAQDLAVKTGVAREQIIGAYTAAAQAGFAEDEWAAFAETSAMMGVAFDTTGDKAGEMLKAWRSGMGLTMKDATALAGAANHLANNMNATALDIGEVMQRQGAVFKSAGISEADGAALSAALLSGGAPAEVAATAGKNFVMALTKGMSATKGQKEALAALGFDDPKALAQQMQEAPQQAIMSVLESIKGLAPDEQTAIMTQLFGSESIGAIAPLIANLGNLSKAFSLVAKEQNYLGSLQAEFNALQGTTNQQAKKAAEGMKAIGTAIGSALLPTINSALAAIAPMALKFAQLAQEYPKVTTAIVGVTASLMAFKVAAIAGGFAFTYLKGAWLSGVAVLKTLRVAMLLNNGTLTATNTTSKAAIAINRGLAASQAALAAATSKGGLMVLANKAIPAVMTALRGLSLAFMATPVGILITAVTTAAVMIYKYWEPIKAFLAGFWDGFVAGIQPVIANLQPLAALFRPIGNAIAFVWGHIQTAISWFASLFTQVKASEQTLASATSAGQKFGSVIAAVFNFIAAPVRGWIMLIQTIPQIFSAAGASIRQIWGSLVSYFSSINLFAVGKNMLQTLISGISTLIGAPKNMAISAINSMKQWLSGFSLYDSGAKMLSTLAAGIRSAVSVPVQAVKGALQKVRNYLPFSDAKEGPLSQLTASGQAIMSTLSAGMSQFGTTNFMQPFIKNASDMMGRAEQMTPSFGDPSPAARPFDQVSSQQTVNQQAPSNGQIVLHLTQQITVGGDAGNIEQQARSGAAAGATDLVRELENLMRQNRRLSFG